MLKDAPPSLYYICRFPTHQTRGQPVRASTAILGKVKFKRTVPKHKKPDESLKGWAAIAKFLRQPTPTVQRWATEGMPLTRIGRYVAASPAELEGWLTREAGAKQTVHIPSANADLLADLKRGLSEARKVRRKSSRF